MKRLLKILALFLSALNATADMLVDDIRIEGLQRVSLGSVLDTVPITIGDRIDKRDYQRVIKTLFGTGQFDDIQLRAEMGISYLLELKKTNNFKY